MSSSSSRSEFFVATRLEVAVPKYRNTISGMHPLSVRLLEVSASPETRANPGWRSNAIEARMTRRGYCHSCKRHVDAEVNGDEEPECQVCHGTFVELEAEERPRRGRRSRRSERTESDIVSRSILQQIVRHEGNAAHFQFTRGTGGVEVLGALQPLLAPNTRTLGDYAFGSLGTIIDQLVASDQGRVPVPASKLAITQLCKTIEIQESHVEQGWKCAINKEPLGIGEKAVTLPCGHVFHDQAILTWLKEHHSCPVCRHELPTTDDDVRLQSSSSNDDDTAPATTTTTTSSPPEPPPPPPVHPTPTTNLPE